MLFVHYIKFELKIKSIKNCGWWFEKKQQNQTHFCL